MSVVFPFILPTTGNLTIAQHVSSSRYHQVVLNADSSRALVRDTLKRAKRADSPDYLEVVKAIDDYLPNLFTILKEEEKGYFKFESIPLVQWRMPKMNSSRTMVEPPKVEVRSLEFEKRMVLITYALALMMLAESVIDIDENGKGIVGDGKDNDRKWKLATAHLLKAQSIFWYLSADSSTQGQSLPVELQNQTGLITGLQTLISGSLHLLIVYKDLERELQESNNGYGGTTSSSSTSRSLLSRVAIFAGDKFGSASQLVSSSTSFNSNHVSTSTTESASSTKTKVKSAMRSFSSGNSSSHSSSTLSLSSSDTLSSWLSEARKFCIGATYKYAGIDQAEKGQTGQAIGFLTAAVDLLGGSNKFKKAVSSNKPGTIQYCQDLLKQTILPILHSYTTENNNYTFQKVPKASELESNRPSGRQVIAANSPWLPPDSLISGSIESHEQPVTGRNYF